jgi:hypothetical protein
MIRYQVNPAVGNNLTLFTVTLIFFIMSSKLIQIFIGQNSYRANADFVNRFSANL